METKPGPDYALVLAVLGTADAFLRESQRLFRPLGLTAAQFNEMAENNHQRTLALRAPRGLVFDRDGRVMVENRRSYSISIVREHTKNLGRTIHLLAAVLGLDESEVRTKVERHRRDPRRLELDFPGFAALARDLRDRDKINS